MSDFKHSIILFAGDDGLPLEFNVRNTIDKSHLKALIEYGGGICTQSENSVHLISPGTKAINVDLGKKLVSSTYIYDCVKQNYLLDVNEYVFTISEAQTSDISDEDSEKLLALRHSTGKSPKKNIPMKNMEISPIKKIDASNETASTTPSNLTLPSSNSALPQVSNSSESFVEGSQNMSTSYKIKSHVYQGDHSFKSNKNIELPEKFQEDSDSLSFSLSLVCPSEEKDFSNKPIGASHNLNLPFDSIQNASSAISPSKPLKTLKNITTPSPPEKQALLSAINLTSAKKLKISETNQRYELPLENQIPDFHVNFQNVPMENESSNSFERNSQNNGLTNNCYEEGDILLSNVSPRKLIEKRFENFDAAKKNLNKPSLHTVVSSSQPEDVLDKFDNMLLNKAHCKPQLEDEDSLSQSYTVSSSADAQVPSKPCSAEDNSPPLLSRNSANLPDSPDIGSSQTNEEEYIRNLEEQVKEILEKDSPKTIQEKIVLVKYVCCVRKLRPRVVLESLLSKSNSLDL